MYDYLKMLKLVESERTEMYTAVNNLNRTTVSNVPLTEEDNLSVKAIKIQDNNTFGDYRQYFKSV